MDTPDQTSPFQSSEIPLPTTSPTSKRSTYVFITIIALIAVFFGGYWYLSTSKKPTLIYPVTTGTPTIKATNEFAGWKTFKNEDVTFAYPPEFIGKPILVRGSGYTQEFTDTNNKYTLSFLSSGNYSQITGKAYETIDEYVGMPYRVTTVVVDGQDARQPLPRAGSENINSVVFFSKNTKKIYTLELQTGELQKGDNPYIASVDDIKQGQNLFTKILSTFKFTDQNQQNQTTQQPSEQITSPINTGVKCVTDIDCKDLPCKFDGTCPIFICQKGDCYEYDKN